MNYIWRSKLKDEEKYTVNPTTNCWEWKFCSGSTFGKNTKSYGRLYVNGKLMSSHRYMYQKHVGNIPKGHFVLHKCDNPPCVNPEHLFIGTCQDNNRDTFLKGRVARGKDIKNNKLSNEQVLEIRNLALSGVNQMKIAKMFGISRQHVSYIKLKKCWKYLPLLILFFSSFAHAAEGYASYYTVESCKREGTSGVYTANGELYKEAGMTCALRRRDFGKSYLVCGQAGCAEVRHNDFGPGKGPTSKGVIIDLTPRAFKAVCGDLRQGRCEVGVQGIVD